MAKSQRILIVDDDRKTAATIKLYLENAGFEVLVEHDGRGALDSARTGLPSLIVLDLMLPRISGLELCRLLRAESEVPVIMLTARTTEEDKLRGLGIGADDYLTKPFSPRELAARVKAVLRRALTPPPPDAPHAAFEVNESKRQISFYGRMLELSRYEHEILSMFIRRPGHVFSRDQLRSQIWEQPETSLERSVDAHIKNLRAKLKAIRPDKDPIVTHRGVGYSLDEDP